MADVVDNPGASRFELEQDGDLAVLEYERHGSRLVLVHTGVPPQLEGNGFGGQLVRASVEKARTDGLTVVPRCPYARSWIEKHPDAVDGVEVDLAG
jgi:predicted GNAT family acetyltransferase